MTFSDHSETSLSLHLMVFTKTNQDREVIYLYVINIVRLNSDCVGLWVEVEHSLSWVEASDYDFSFSTEFIAILLTILATY